METTAPATTMLTDAEAARLARLEELEAQLAAKLERYRELEAKLEEREAALNAPPQVEDEGEPIFDPKTGRVIGKRRRELVAGTDFPEDMGIDEATRTGNLALVAAVRKHHEERRAAFGRKRAS